MKKYALLTVVALLSLLAFFPSTGCKTTPDGTKVVDTNAVQEIAVVFRNAARTSAIMVIADEPTSKVWFQLATTAIGQFVQGSVHDPQAFKAALAALPQLSNKWTAFIVGSVVDAYEIYYINYSAPLSDRTVGSWVACQFLAAIQQGFADAVTTGRARTGTGHTLDQALSWLKVKVELKAALKPRK